MFMFLEYKFNGAGERVIIDTETCRISHHWYETHGEWIIGEPGYYKIPSFINELAEGEKTPSTKIEASSIDELLREPALFMILL